MFIFKSINNEKVKIMKRKRNGEFFLTAYKLDILHYLSTICVKLTKS